MWPCLSGSQQAAPSLEENATHSPQVFFKTIPKVDHGATNSCRIETKIQAMTTRPL